MPHPHPVCDRQTSQPSLCLLPALQHAGLKKNHKKCAGKYITKDAKVAKDKKDKKREHIKKHAKKDHKLQKQDEQHRKRSR